MEQQAFRIDFAGIHVNNNAVATDMALVNSFELFDKFDTDGPDRASQSDQANSQLIISASGIYLVSFGCSVSVAGANKVFEKNVFEIGETEKTITGTTKADPVVVTATAHGFSNGDEVKISGVTTMVEINNRIFKVADKTDNTFELTDDGGTSPGDDIDGSAFAGAGTGGVVQLATRTASHAHRQYVNNNVIGYDASPPFPVELTAGNFLELYLMNVTDATDPTVEHCHLVLDWKG